MGGVKKGGVASVLLPWCALLWVGGCGSEQEQAAPAAEVRADAAPTLVFSTVNPAGLTGLESAGEAWLLYGGAYNNQRYSALEQITRENVAQLVPAWVHQTGVSESFQTTPLVVGKIMYLTTAESRVIALNAATGELLWRFTPSLGSTVLCCGPNNRGVAASGDQVFVGTLDANLFALDHRTGEVRWQTQVADPEDGYSITMAPLAVNDQVIVGVSGGKYGIRGFLAAFDAASGRQTWRWYTVPAPGEAPNGWWGDWRDTDPYGTNLNRDVVRERADSARYADAWRRGGGAVWMTPAYDPATNTLFASVGNPAPALDGVIRPGDNLYTGSIVALDAGNGTLKWYFQYLPHDVWDLSPGSAPFVLTLDGRKLVGHAAKTGWLYLVDAGTGAPVLRSENFVPQDNLFARPTETGVRVAPGSNGGASWSPVAFSPRTGLVYVPAIHQPMILTRSYQPREPGRLWLGGSFRISPEDASWGLLSAIDPRTGAIRWQSRSPAPMAGAALVTAGDVLFVGQGTGTLDAFDATSGQLLWQFPTGAGTHGGPVTYSIDGVQYVVVAAGGNYQLDTPRGDAVIAFRLHDSTRTLPRPYEPVPGYPRAGAIRYGEVRQVPAAELDQLQNPAPAQPAQPAQPQN
jgi:alcohol dehydrogenase (cytochrome c)